MNHRHACTKAFFPLILITAAVVGSAATARPVELMPADRLAKFQKAMPPVADPDLNDIMSSDDTVWYDKFSIIPGYQDSFGDNVILPIGMRPNTIDSNLIDLAVPGGHADIFFNKGQFHFPFGRTGGLDFSSNTFVIDFWKLPRSGGKILPVAWTKWEPNQYTHRYEWIFPVGTVFGEVLFLVDGADYYCFEIRTRTRYLKGWTVDVFRPFKTATDLAQALERKRKQKTSWETNSQIEALITHLRKPDTLTSAKLEATHFAKSFAKVDGATDALPEVKDSSIFKELLRFTVFDSVKGVPWKQSSRYTTFAPSSMGEFGIVPKKYEGSMFEVSETFCNRCHMDAGRPFKDYYPKIQAYGELWGEDDVFSWHPFEANDFVDSAGKVKNFNNDNRNFRQDFVKAGIIEKYDSKKHSSTFYERLNRSWKNYKH